MKQLTIEHLKQSFESEGYQLLTTNYINAHQKLEFICPEGHNHSISWSSWQQGHRCGKCTGLYKNIGDMVKSFESEGYQLLTTKYTSPFDKLEFICSNGHRYNISWTNWQQGQRCAYCKGNVRLSYEQVSKSFIDEGYNLLTTEYKNAHQHLEFVCNMGHYNKMTWNNWSKGYRCGKCRTSKPESQLLNYIKFTYPHLNIVHNDRTQIKNPSTGCYLEFDIWIPELNKAIEMDGVAIHSFRQNNDELKCRLCEEKGIPLLRITDKEWYTCPDVRVKIHQFVMS